MSTSQRKAHFPFAGELFKTKKRKFKELIFFVHFYGGNKRVLRRHIALVNKLGYDAFAFNLHGNLDDLLSFKKFPIGSNDKMGLVHIYADQIEACLNCVSEIKIVYGFSNPCLGLIEALAHRKCSDVKAMICDSGPGGKNLLSSAFRLMRSREHSIPISAFLAGAMALGWDRDFGQNTRKNLALFPKNFPVLSIRGWKDLLISPEEIDCIFDPHIHLNWRKLALPEAGHLNGLRDFSSEYVPPLKKFLEEVSTLL